jgi:hypothetical protein
MTASQLNLRFIEYDESGYFTPDHPEAFLDMVKLDRPIQWHPELDTECPVCHGYGGWNLKVRCYPLREGQSAHFAHFRCHCTQCQSWGWVQAGPDTSCIHEFSRELGLAECRARGLYHAGRCWHVMQCVRCGATRSYDSSD